MTKRTITLRLNSDVYELVERRAVKASRSKNGQINYELGQKDWVDDIMIEWALAVMKRRGNPPYVLEDLRKQLRRELDQFKRAHL